MTGHFWISGSSAPFPAVRLKGQDQSPRLCKASPAAPVPTRQKVEVVNKGLASGYFRCVYQFRHLRRAGDAPRYSAYTWQALQYTPFGLVGRAGIEPACLAAPNLHENRNNRLITSMAETERFELSVGFEATLAFRARTINLTRTRLRRCERWRGRVPSGGVYRPPRQPYLGRPTLIPHGRCHLSWSRERDSNPTSLYDDGFTAHLLSLLHIPGGGAGGGRTLNGREAHQILSLAAIPVRALPRGLPLPQRRGAYLPYIFAISKMRILNAKTLPGLVCRGGFCVWVSL